MTVHDDRPNDGPILNGIPTHLPDIDPAETQEWLDSLDALVDELGARSVAFPLVSAGIYGWPKGDAVACAVETIRATPTAVEDVAIVVLDEPTAQMVRAELG